MRLTIQGREPFPSPFFSPSTRRGHGWMLRGMSCKFREMFRPQPYPTGNQGNRGGCSYGISVTDVRWAAGRDGFIRAKSPAMFLACHTVASHMVLHLARSQDLGPDSGPDQKALAQATREATWVGGAER